MAITQGAVERGPFGAPTFFIGDEMFFMPVAAKSRA
jgi:2-hydroxychromene-2-carboxylate isomerase